MSLSVFDLFKVDIAPTNGAAGIVPAVRHYRMLISPLSPWERGRG
ncbi:hypothetical protein [Pseudomonas sp. D(2018)]|nr:hypothetical protein [Pseudomonas sp. D(2018)]MDE3739910.1 hypothetical protein [Pseudomonas resinovorans]